MIKWNEQKNEQLKAERGISFEEVAKIILNKDYLGIIKNPNYSNQRIFVVSINDYVYAVPFVIDGKDIFLKTIFPSRRLKKKFME